MPTAYIYIYIYICPQQLFLYHHMSLQIMAHFISPQPVSAQSR